MNDKEKTKRPFIMKPDGVASVFGPGRADGPFPEHYEPLECPVPKNTMSSQFVNPTIKIFSGEANKHLTCDPMYPIVATTYRVTEHGGGGGGGGGGRPAFSPDGSRGWSKRSRNRSSK